MRIITLAAVTSVSQRFRPATIVPANKRPTMSRQTLRDAADMIEANTENVADTLEANGQNAADAVRAAGDNTADQVRAAGKTMLTPFVTAPTLTETARTKGLQTTRTQVV